MTTIVRITCHHAAPGKLLSIRESFSGVHHTLAIGEERAFAINDSNQHEGVRQDLFQISLREIDAPAVAETAPADDAPVESAGVSGSD